MTDDEYRRLTGNEPPPPNHKFMELLGHDGSRTAGKQRANKLNAVKKVVDNITFDSTAEAERYKELCELVLSGDIKNLQHQVTYKLIVEGELVCRYIADFVYEANGITVVEDVKGYRGGATYGVFRLKKKLMKACHGIDILEVTMKPKTKSNGTIVPKREKRIEKQS